MYYWSFSSRGFYLISRIVWYPINKLLLMHMLHYLYILCIRSSFFWNSKLNGFCAWYKEFFKAKHNHALSSRDAQVASLKHCWDMLKCENKTFLTVVTSAFPCDKEQDALINELRHSGYFDVFQVCQSASEGSSEQTENLKWGCFLCAHPERAVGFLRGMMYRIIMFHY